MKHLLVEDIIEFVSAEEFNDRFLELASDVTTHICECEECRRKVRAFQMVYDELKATAFESRGAVIAEFKKDAEQMVEKKLSKKKDLDY